MEREEHFAGSSKCEILMPNGTDICLDKDDCEKKVNIALEKMKTVNISGYIYDCNDKPVENAIVRLYEYVDCDHLKAVCYTLTNCEGFYVINLKGDFVGKYHISVSTCKEIKKHHLKDKDCDCDCVCDCDCDCDDEDDCDNDNKESYSCDGCKRKDCVKRQEPRQEIIKIDYSNFH